MYLLAKISGSACPDKKYNYFFTVAVVPRLTLQLYQNFLLIMLVTKLSMIFEFGFGFKELFYLLFYNSLTFNR